MQVNKAKILEHFDNDEELLQDLVMVFEDSYPNDMAMIEKSIAASDFPNLQLYAHSLKGSLSHFFVDELHLLAKELEDDGRNKCLDHQNNFTVLKDQIPKLIQELKK